MVQLSDTARALLALRLAGATPRQLSRHLAGEALDLLPIGEAALERELERLERLELTVLAITDAGYPARLRSISSPPPLLWAQGNLALLSEPRLLAVVGTRSPSQFGLVATSVLVGAAAETGFGVVSGLALGIDTLGHRLALDHQTGTIAILGCGLDRVYPAENRPLAARILAEGGLLLSEQPPGSAASAGTLIARNRLQSGLSVAVFVGQTGVVGGTMHTVRFALEQGRPVFCPDAAGSDHPASSGLQLLASCPVEDLPASAAAFAQAKRLCATIGARPAARPLRREDQHVFVSELLTLAR